MDFTYNQYGFLIDLLIKHGYQIANYHNYSSYNKCAILRHDVDLSIDSALSMALFEHEKGVSSTYFILLSTDMYNPASLSSFDKIMKIKNLGHDIGLHFDEKKYSNASSIPESNSDETMKKYIENEITIFSKILGIDIRSVSMHRPSSETLAADYKFQGTINSYSSTFFKDFKYLSDSRRHWREPVIDIVNSNSFDRLHILTHPEWYCGKEISGAEMLSNFIGNAKYERWNNLNDNIRDLSEFVRPEDV